MSHLKLIVDNSKDMDNVISIHHTSNIKAVDDVVDDNVVAVVPKTPSMKKKKKLNPHHSDDITRMITMMNINQSSKVTCFYIQ